MNNRTGGQAFPSEDSGEGMTLRDWFAGQALNALLSNSDAVKAISEVCFTSITEPSEFVAEAAYTVADDMLVRRENDGS